MIEVTKRKNSIQPSVPYMARHSGPSTDAALGTRTRKGKKDEGRWKSDRSVLRVPQIVPLAASSLPSLRPEVRKRVAQSDRWLHSDCGLPVASLSVNLFLPKRPRGAYFVVLSNARCKFGRTIRQRGFLHFRVRGSSQAPFRC